MLRNSTTISKIENAATKRTSFGPNSATAERQLTN